MPTITFSPSGKTITVPTHTPLLHACRLAGIELSTPCAEKGFCGKCRVKVLSGNIPIDAKQNACLPLRLLKDGWRATCIVQVNQDVTLADPAQTQTVVLSDFSGREPGDDNAIWQCDVTVQKPSTHDQTDDLRRILNALPESLPLAESQPCLPALLRRLPQVLRSANFSCRVLGMGDLLLDITAPDADAEPTGLAIDIGTTTIALALCRLRDGETLATASCANPQSAWGDDVISRIECAGQGRNVVIEMRDRVVRAIEELAAEACGAAGEAQPPLLAAVAANTVMTHLLLGVSPSALAMSPFTPVFRDGITLSAAELGWRGLTPPLVRVLPCVSAFVGGDVVAGILVHDLHRDEGVTILLDAGTNGEIALSVRGELYACSTAAGPAFEGARISQGMRASPGAISRVGLEEGGGLEVGTIDALEAKGVCGTGLLDAVATLRRGGVIDEYGGVVDGDEAEAEGINPDLAGRIVEEEKGRAVRLAGGEDGKGVFLTQRDVREFQLAKGAIAAGIRVLCGEAGIGLEEVGRVLLAGGFGNYLDPGSAVGAGLLPLGIRVEGVRPVGNAALAGARLCLLSPGERKAAEVVAGRVRHVELAGREDFQRIFAEEMLFPVMSQDD